MQNFAIYKSFDPNKSDTELRKGAKGTVCQLSWKTLKEDLEKACKLSKNEKLTGIVVDEYGIQFRIELK